MSLTSTVAQRRSTVEQLELRNLLASDGFMGSELPDGAPLTAEVAETLTELSILPLAESVERGDPQSSFDGRQVQSASRRSDEASASGTDSDSSVEDPTPVVDVPVDASPVDGQPADEEPVSEEPVDTVDDEPVDEAPIDATPLEDDEKPVPGDANGDGQIGFADFLIVSEYFGKTDAVFEEGDFDGDGTVAFNDFLYVANFFDADSIPEGRRPRDEVAFESGDSRRPRDEVAFESGDTRRPRDEIPTVDDSSPADSGEGPAEDSPAVTE